VAGDLRKEVPDPIRQLRFHSHNTQFLPCFIVLYKFRGDKISAGDDDDDDDSGSTKRRGTTTADKIEIRYLGVRNSHRDLRHYVSSEKALLPFCCSDDQQQQQQPKEGGDRDRVEGQEKIAGGRRRRGNSTGRRRGPPLRSERNAQRAGNEQGRVRQGGAPEGRDGCCDGAAAQHDTASNDDGEQTAPAGARKVSPLHAQRYLKYIGKHKDFRGVDGPMLLKVEELFLQLLLEALLDGDDCKQGTGGAALLKNHEEGPDGDTDDGGDDVGGDCEDDAPLEPENRRPPLPQPARAVGRRCLDVDDDDSKKSSLRAGDTVRYIDPMKVAGTPGAVCQADITCVYPKRGRDIVLELSDGASLRREDRIQLVSRYLRGKSKPEPQRPYMLIDEYKLDCSMNGKFDGQSFANTMESFMKETGKQLEAAAVEALNDAGSNE